MLKQKQESYLVQVTIFLNNKIVVHQIQDSSPHSNKIFWWFEQENIHRVCILDYYFFICIHMRV